MSSVSLLTSPPCLLSLSSLSLSLSSLLDDPTFMLSPWQPFNSYHAHNDNLFPLLVSYIRAGLTNSKKVERERERERERLSIKACKHGMSFIVLGLRVLLLFI